MQREAASDTPGTHPHPDVFRNMLKESDTPTWRALLVLVASLGLFAFTAGATITAQDVGVVIAVLLFHEAGHFVGMRAFGYRDVRMFFIPFFGAAVRGRPNGVVPYKRAIVLLLGPLPGLIAAAVIAFTWRPSSHEPLGRVVLMLAVVNGLNLLPLEPFDGGKLAHLLVASRFRALDVASLVAGTLGTALLAVKLQSPALQSSHGLLTGA